MVHDKIRPDEVSAIIQKELESLSAPYHLEEVGTVLQISDNVAIIYGLEHVQAGELIVFENGEKGLVLNLEKECIRAIILGDGHTLQEGHLAKRTHNIVSIKFSEKMVGRVVNTLGEPIDDAGPISGPFFEMPLMRKAPGVIYRQPVNEPLQTGIKIIDAMIPIGLGQRQLIVGDRQTGKTTLALDTIINQRRRFEQGDPVYCIYAAIGQKASDIAKIVATLKKYGAMDYSIVVASSPATPSSLQFLAPFAATTIGEFFRDTGRHAVVVYDDLSKHATAYREISLLLRRPPGRKAYPGDIFFQHAQLLERAAKINCLSELAAQMNDLPVALKPHVKGGGSLTALPIIETQAGDVSDYIPTNVISITDGQIFLETALFNAGIRPAINIGLSVSRVGGAAQAKPMKSVAGKLKLEQAQFLEIESFAKFGSELDSFTRMIIDRGRKNQAILKQDPYAPIPVEQQVAIIYASCNGYLDDIPLNRLPDFIESYISQLMMQHQKTMLDIAKGIFDDAAKEVLGKMAEASVRAYAKAG